MFAALPFEREPLQFGDLPVGMVTWLQDVGGFCAAALAIWLIVARFRRAPVFSHGPPSGLRSVFRTLFAVLVAVAFVLYAVAGAVLLPELFRRVFGEGGAGGQQTAGQSQLEFWCLTVGGACAAAALFLPFLLDLLEMRWRRIWALARLSFREAVRRRVLWVFSALLVVFLFGSWFLPYEDLKAEDQVRNYVTVVYWAMTPLLLMVASLLAAFSLPTDIRNQTIHTILTKPVERYEVVVGRFLGYTLLMTLVLLVMTAFSLVYVFRGVSPEAAYESLKARVPLYGDRLVFEENNRIKEKGENVGKEWDYRSYIAGPMPGVASQAVTYALWDFGSIPSSLANRDTARLEYNFDIYRTTKGEENKGVFCIFYFETRNWSKDRKGEYDQFRKKLREEGVAEQEVNDRVAEQFGYYQSPTKMVVNNHTLLLEVPTGLFRNAQRDERPPADSPYAQQEPPPPLRVRVECVSRTQFLGMAKYDLYFRLDQPDSPMEQWLFAANFFKGATGLWLRLCLVIGVAVALSTYLNGQISWLGTMFLFTAGLFRDFVRSLAAGTNYGGGPATALLNLVQKQNPLAEIEKTATVQVASGSDEVYRWVLRRFINVIPDVERFDFTDMIREGFDVSGDRLLVNTLLLLGYLLPWGLLGYYLMRSREIAGAT